MQWGGINTPASLRSNERKEKNKRQTDLRFKNKEMRDKAIELRMMHRKNEIMKEQMDSQNEFLKKQLWWNRILVIGTIILSTVSIVSTIILATK